MCMSRGFLTQTRRRLRNYHALVLEIRQLNRQLADEYRKHSPVPAVSHLCRMGGGQSHVHGSAVERCVIKQAETQAEPKVKQLARQIAKLEKEKKKIDTTLEILSPEEKELVTLRYLHNESHAWIESHVTASTCQLPAVLHEAIVKIACVLYFCENAPTETKALLLA